MAKNSNLQLVAVMKHCSVKPRLPETAVMTLPILQVGDCMVVAPIMK